MQTRTHFRWLVIGLLFYITITNYVDRSSISYAMSQMAAQFHFNPDQVGMIFGAFGVGYMITTFLGGIAVDRYGVRIILTGSALLWSIAVGMTGLITGFFMAYLARVLLGVAEGPNFPAITRATSDWLPKHERAIALSNSLVAVPLALAIGAPIVSQLIAHFSWHVMFFILSIAGLIWLPLWWFFYRDFPENSSHVNQAELNYIREGEIKRENFNAKKILENRKHQSGIWKFLFINPTLIANNWSFFVFGYFLFFFMTWLPSYLADQYHLNLKEIGWFASLPWLVAAILLFLVGYLSDTILKKTGSYRLSRSYPIWISQLLAALCIFPIILTHNITIAIIFISLAVGFGMSANSTFYATNIDIIKERAGSSLGIMDTAFALAGFAAPVITGMTIKLTGNFTSAFVLLIVLALSSVLMVFFMHQPDRHIR